MPDRKRERVELIADERNPDFYQRCVSQWLRARAGDPSKSHQTAIIEQIKWNLERGEDVEKIVRYLFVQLAADADHSRLLPELFNGKRLD